MNEIKIIIITLMVGLLVTGFFVGVAFERQQLIEYCVSQGYDGYSEYFETCTYTDCIKGGNPKGVRD